LLRGNSGGSFASPHFVQVLFLIAVFSVVLPETWGVGLPVGALNEVGGPHEWIETHVALTNPLVAQPASWTKSPAPAGWEGAGERGRQPLGEWLGRSARA
jgi:hypothetical protein